MKRMPDHIVDEARKLIFDDGMKCVDVAKIVGYNAALISKRLKESGFTIPRSNSGRRKVSLPVGEIISMYESGVSEQAVALHFGLSRDVIRNRLSTSGVKIRTQSEASILSASQATPEQRKARAIKANIAKRGVKEKESSRIMRAKTLENNAYGNMTGKGELEMKIKLDSIGVDYVWQKAIGRYSLDFMIGGLALELRSGLGYRGDTHISNGRIGFLKDNGLTTMYVLFDTVENLLKSFDYIMDQVNSENNNPSKNGVFKIITIRTKSKELLQGEGGRFYSNKIEPLLINQMGVYKY